MNRAVVLVVGRRAQPAGDAADTWEWDGKAWSKIAG